MNEIYASIMQGLQEAVEDAAGRRKLPRKTIGESGDLPKGHAGCSGAGTSCKERGAVPKMSKPSSLGKV